jgi:hypothetical protein
MKDSLASVQNAVLRQLIGNQVCGAPPVVAINAGSAATVKSTNAISFINGGLLLTKAALSAQALTVDATVQALNTNGATFYTQPASTTSYLVLCLDASGNVRCVQGSYSGQLVAPYQMEQGMGVYPVVTATYTPFSIIKVVTGATTFLPGTDALDKASVTFTFKDIAMLPTALI